MKRGYNKEKGVICKVLKRVPVVFKGGMQWDQKEVGVEGNGKQEKGKEGEDQKAKGMEAI